MPLTRVKEIINFKKIDIEIKCCYNCNNYPRSSTFENVTTQLTPNSNVCKELNTSVLCNNVCDLHKPLIIDIQM